LANSHNQLSKFVNAFEKYFWLRVIIFLSILLSVWSIRFPFIFRKVYAEDGALFLADAIKYSFPSDLVKPAAGYSTLIMRIGGRFVSIFPIEFAALISGTFTAICLSFLAAGIFQFNNFINKDFWSRFTLSLCFMFLPLATYSAIGNIANLYVYFMTACAVFLYYHEKNSWETIFKCSVLFIAALSLPLTIFLMPIMLHRMCLDKKYLGYWKMLKSDIIFLVGVTIQFMFIAVTSFGERVPHSPQSLFKVLYLYFERGIGISIIPKWGFIAGTSGEITFENSVTWLESVNLRLIIVLVAVVALALVYYKNRFSMSSAVREQAILITLLGFIYSLMVGLFFNPEPRYMLFTSFLTLWVILLLLETESKIKFKFVALSYLSIVLILALTSSSHRSQGPDWKSSIEEARRTCLGSQDLQQVRIRTLPLDANWEILIPCEKLR
jgi:hypothetical protein